MGKQRPLLAAVMATVGVAALYRARIRPWMYHWGATPAEVNAVLPGDDLMCPSATRTTRAVTVDAPISTVWRWLSRIGEGGDGHYTYRWLERGSTDGHTSVGTLHPHWLDLRVGDVIWLAHRYGPTARQVVAAIEPESYLVVVSARDFERIRHGQKASGAWGAYLRRSGSCSRLLIRGTGGSTGRFGFDIARFVVELALLRVMRTHAQRISPATATPVMPSDTTALAPIPDRHTHRHGQSRADGLPSTPPRPAASCAQRLQG
jgi:hypothetical protein